MRDDVRGKDSVYVFMQPLRYRQDVKQGRLLYEVSKVVWLSQGRPEGSLFNSYYTEVLGRVLRLSLDCSTLPLIHTLYCWVLSKEVSSTIFKVFGMTQPRIEPRSPGPLAKPKVKNQVCPTIYP